MDLYARLVDLVADERARHALRTRQPGTRSRPTDLERALGLHPNWFPRMVAGEMALTIERAQRYFELTGTDPRLALATVAEVGEGSVIAALRRHAASPPPLRPAPRPTTSAPAADRQELTDLDRRLTEIDSRRLSDTAAAFRAARRAAKEAERRAHNGPSIGSSRCYSKGALVLGSVAARSSSYAIAASCYREGIDAAAAWQLPAERCELHIRAFSLLRDLCDLDAATEAAACAVALASSLGDPSLLSKALHQRASAAHLRGDEESALRLFEAAGAVHPPARPAAIAARAYVLRSAGRARDALALADEAAKQLPPAMAAYAEWIRAEAQFTLGRYKLAEACAQAALDTLPSAQPEDQGFLRLLAATAALHAGRENDAIVHVRLAQSALLPLAGTALADRLLTQLGGVSAQANEQRLLQCLALARRLREDR